MAILDLPLSGAMSLTEGNVQGVKDRYGNGGG